jgi:hypothetical protein
MQKPGYGLRKIHLLGTWVNKGKKEKGQDYKPRPQVQPLAFETHNLSLAFT